MKTPLYVKMALTQPQSRQTLTDVVRRTGGVEFANGANAERASVLFYELNGNPDMDFEVIGSFREKEGIPHLFLLSEHPTQEVLMRAIKAGAREFFTAPLKAEEVASALEKIKAQAEETASSSERTSGRIVTVVGSKGGVGATTVAVNLAAALAAQNSGARVALLDMNTLFGDIPLFLDLKAKFHWGEITRNLDRLDEAFLNNVLERHASGVSVLTSPGHLNGHEAPTPESMDRLLGLMQTQFDVTVIDTGQATDDTALRILQLSDTVLLVSVLSLPCLSNVNRIIQSFTGLGYTSRENIQVVVNRYLKKTEISLADAEAGIGRKVFGIVPNDYRATMSAINQGKPVIELAPKSGLAAGFRRMAESLAGTDPSAPRKRKRFLFL
jgi:pilus assembly protein CpaE